jgi:hypothetical protein
MSPQHEEVLTAEKSLAEQPSLPLVFEVLKEILLSEGTRLREASGCHGRCDGGYIQRDGLGRSRAQRSSKYGIDNNVDSSKEFLEKYLRINRLDSETSNNSRNYKVNHIDSSGSVDFREAADTSGSSGAMVKSPETIETHIAEDGSIMCNGKIHQSEYLTPEVLSALEGHFSDPKTIYLNGTRPGEIGETSDIVPFAIATFSFDKPYV